MSCEIKSILTSLQKTTFVEYFYPTKEAIVVSNEFDAISPAINVYLLLIIVGIEPIDKPSKTIKIPPTINHIKCVIIIVCINLIIITRSNNND